MPEQMGMDLHPGPAVNGNQFDVLDFCGDDPGQAPADAAEAVYRDTDGHGYSLYNSLVRAASGRRRPPNALTYVNSESFNPSIILSTILSTQQRELLRSSLVFWR
jgi:hypothetical protein